MSIGNLGDGCWNHTTQIDPLFSYPFSISASVTSSITYTN